MRWSEAEYARYIQNTEQNTSSPKPKNKYSSQKTWIDGICFDSKKEADYYCQLKLLTRAGDKRFLSSSEICCDRGCREYRTRY